MAARYQVDDDKLLKTLKATCFKGSISDEQMMALMVVANEYKLNPFTREIFAFPDKQNGIVPVVSVDGWARIINEHPMFDGLEFNYSDDTTEDDPSEDGNKPMHKECPDWCEVVIYRKDREQPITVREYLDEVYREAFKHKDKGYYVAGPWQSHTKRMLRHKALIQGARIAFGFAGIYDQDEAERIIESTVVVEHAPIKTPKRLSEVPAEVPEEPAMDDTEKLMERLSVALVDGGITVPEFLTFVEVKKWDDLRAHVPELFDTWMAWISDHAA
jgi:phage recombination protein Bet